MDIWGIVLFIVGVAGFFFLRNRARGWAEFSLWVCGIGAGIFIGALWAVYIMESTFSRFDW